MLRSLARQKVFIAAKSVDSCIEIQVEGERKSRPHTSRLRPDWQQAQAFHSRYQQYRTTVCHIRPTGSPHAGE